MKTLLFKSNYPLQLFERLLIYYLKVVITKALLSISEMKGRVEDHKRLILKYKKISCPKYDL